MSEDLVLYGATPTVTLKVPFPLVSRAVTLRLLIDYGPDFAVESVTWRRDDDGDWQPLVKGVQP